MRGTPERALSGRSEHVARDWLERAAARGVADAQHDLAELSPPLGDAEWTPRSDQVVAPTA